MWHLIWPIAIVVAANTLYNICAKSTPADVPAFASLTITYGVATGASLLLYFCSGGRTAWADFGKANWTSYALGVAIVGLEFGFLCVYRAGWKIGTAHLVASLALSCVLLIVGLLGYHETLQIRQWIGIAVCAVGLILIA